MKEIRITKVHKARKAILAGTLALVMAFGTASLAFAGEIVGNNSGDTTLSATVAPTYTVSIPDSVNDFPAYPNPGETAAKVITYKNDSVIPATKRVKVAITGVYDTSSSGFAISNGTHTVAYDVSKISGGSALKSGDEIASFVNAGDTQNFFLKINDWTTAVTSGDYTGTLRFTVSLVDKA